MLLYSAYKVIVFKDLFRKMFFYLFSTLSINFSQIGALSK